VLNNRLSSAPRQDWRPAPILVLGAQGQVGTAVAARAADEGFACEALGRADCDITDRRAVMRAVEQRCFVINCAAYTAVDRAETDVEAAKAVNSMGAENVAVACADATIPLIHLSTDYVFDGKSPRPAREEDRPRPLNVYGRTKLEGEIAIRKHLVRHIILRTSWVFSTHGHNFVTTILRLARSHPELQVVDDQIGGPTAATDIASAIAVIIKATADRSFLEWGTYHYCGIPSVTWFEFARTIVEGWDVQVSPVATKDYSRQALRPSNSVLDCSRILRIFGIRQPDWRIAPRQVQDADRASPAGCKSESARS